MKIGKYETSIFKALKDRIFPPGLKHPKRSFWVPTDGWVSDPKEIENAIRMDDVMSIGEKHE